jgi:hypothetical protein
MKLKAKILFISRLWLKWCIRKAANFSHPAITGGRFPALLREFLPRR